MIFSLKWKSKHQGMKQGAVYFYDLNSKRTACMWLWCFYYILYRPNSRWADTYIGKSRSAISPRVFTAELWNFTGKCKGLIDISGENFIEFCTQFFILLHFIFFSVGGWGITSLNYMHTEFSPLCRVAITHFLNQSTVYGMNIHVNRLLNPAVWQLQHFIVK